MFWSQNNHSTAVHELVCTKWKSDNVSKLDYMIYDGGCYSIFDKDKILLLLDKIDQKIIWMCHLNFI